MSSFTNGIKLNNLQIQLNTLETEVSNIIASGGGGGTGGIIGDLNMNNHSVTNVSTIQLNNSKIIGYDSNNKLTYDNNASEPVKVHPTIFLTLY